MMTWLATQARARKLYLSVLTITILLYLALAVGSALTKRPWSDEGWFASPAFNLVTKGRMGTTVLEPSGWLKGINEYTYWVMPLHLVTQAGWYKVFGFSLLSLRVLSIFWGLVALLSWFTIMKALSGDRKVALVALAFIALDYLFIMSASFGRMDMMCAALGFAAIASYLRLRQRNLTLAVIVSQSLVAASGMTHHLGILPFAGLAFLTLYYDRKRVAWRHIGIAAVPYVLGAAAWAIYILQEPALFFAQFTGNATNTGRLSGLTAPWSGFAREITQRYFVAFGLGAHSAGHSGLIALKALILLAYVAGVIGALLTSGIRRHKGYRALLALAAIYFVIMSVFDGQKLSWYLIHIVPVYGAILAVWLNRCWEDAFVPRWAIAFGVCCMLSLQLGGVLQRARMDTYHNSYLPAAAFLKSNADKSSLIMGSAELGFELGFSENLVDDSWLGYHTGKQPDFIVVDEIYQDVFNGVRAKEPQVYGYITGRLNEQYRKVYDRGFYQIYARNEEAVAALPDKEPEPLGDQR